jgi:hypothetical protein
VLRATLLLDAHLKSLALSRSEHDDARPRILTGVLAFDSHPASRENRLVLSRRISIAGRVIEQRGQHQDRRALLGVDRRHMLRKVRQQDFGILAARIESDGLLDPRVEIRERLELIAPRSLVFEERTEAVREPVRLTLRGHAGGSA